MPASDAPTAGSGGDTPPEDGDGEGGPNRPTIALTRTDERVLAYLDDAGSDYPAFVAGNTGLYVDHVESRLDALDAAGLVEQVTGEEVFRITEAGCDALREDCAVWSD